MTRTLLILQMTMELSINDGASDEQANQWSVCSPLHLFMGSLTHSLSAARLLSLVDTSGSSNGCESESESGE